MEATNPGAPPQTVSPSEVGLPLLALVVSGGHTHLYLARQGSEAAWHYQNVGRTVDDAAGEAQDSEAKLLGLVTPEAPGSTLFAPTATPLFAHFTFAWIKPRGQKLELASSNRACKSSGAPSLQLYRKRVGSQKPDLAQTSGLPASTSPSAASKIPQSSATPKTHNMRTATEHRASIHTNRQPIPQTQPCREQPSLHTHPQPPNTWDLIASFQHAVVGNLRPVKPSPPPRPTEPAASWSRAE